MKVYRRTMDSLQGRLDQMPPIREDFRIRMMELGRDGDVWDDPVFKMLQVEQNALNQEENEIRRKLREMEPLTKAEIGETPQTAMPGTEVEVLFHPVVDDDRESFVLGTYEDAKAFPLTIEGPRILNIESPLGKALLGATVNSIKSFQPNEILQTTFTVLSIKPSEFLVEP